MALTRYQGQGHSSCPIVSYYVAWVIGNVATMSMLGMNKGSPEVVWALAKSGQLTNTSNRTKNVCAMHNRHLRHLTVTWYF